jgi:UDP-3-O-[3-hydroxymyristoyl] N-acetylglucosamine deacetylase
MTFGPGVKRKRTSGRFYQLTGRAVSHNLGRHMRRRTIAHEIRIQGIGLHRGTQVELSIRPGEAGIAFTRAGVRIPASAENVVDTTLNTTIGIGGARVSTIEHLMSALWGLCLTDCEVEIHGEEIPVLDGSAKPFFQAICEAGFADLPGEAVPLEVPEVVRIEEGASWIEARPGRFALFYEIDFPGTAIGQQRFFFDGSNYGDEIAPARTFGMLCDVEKMHALGLALGGSLDNAVVVDKERVVNPGGFRFPDECVRHKVLDLLGDLWTLGAPLKAEIRAARASHRLHIALAKKIRGAYSRGRG